MVCLAVLLAHPINATESSSSEQALRARVSELYTAIQGDDWDKVESFLTDESKSIFRTEPKRGIRGFEIKTVKIDPGGQTATVVAEIPVFGAGSPGPIPVEKITHWRLVHDVWYVELPKSDPHLLQSLYTAPPKRAFSVTPLAVSKDLKFESNWCGLGDVYQDQRKIARFAFKNVSSHAVTLVEVQTGCDCLQLKNREKEFKPGEQAALEFAFDPSDMPVAMKEALTQTILLKTEPGDAYVKLTVSAILAPGDSHSAQPHPGGGSGTGNASPPKS